MRALVGNAQGFNSYTPLPDDHPDSIHYYKETKVDVPLPRASALPENEDMPRRKAGTIARKTTVPPQKSGTASLRLSPATRRQRCEPKLVARFSIAPE